MTTEFKDGGVVPDRLGLKPLFFGCDHVIPKEEFENLNAFLKTKVYYRRPYQLQLWVGWDPVRDQPGSSWRAKLVRVAEFLQQPQTGEHVKIGGEFFKVAQFYHNLDDSQLVVQLVQEWAHSPAEAQKRVEALKAAGWNDAQV